MLRQNNARMKPRRFVAECDSSTEAKTSRSYEFSLAKGLESKSNESLSDVEDYYA